MPTFDTPHPISVSIDSSSCAGTVRVSASRRTDTVVAVRPADEHSETDVRGAAETRVEYSSGRLTVRTPRPRNFGLFGRSPGVDVVVELPEGSSLEATLGAGSAQCSGTLGECRLRTGAGDVRIENAASLVAHSGMGAVDAERVSGDADLTTGSGRIQVREVGGQAVLKNGNGDTWVGSVSGDLRANAANGSIVAEHTGAPVTASTAHGDIRLGDVVRGATTLKSAAGRIEVGIRPGTAARLDLHTHFGRVVNELDSTDGPASEQRAEVRARTGFGDIVIRRAPQEES